MFQGFRSCLLGFALHQPIHHVPSVRLRIAELLEAADMTPYEFAKRSGISRSAIYRVVGLRGRVAYFDAKLLAALVTVLGAAPADLFELPKRRAVRH